ncbi:hypothetical protein Pint_27040 [Pistacia integerrima]|uniref:Uncharacterized protein n=1 Tax=Pistacia integerrima TaxID=434235 RepID=A0ACC0YN29_9ROSI|nr:hypothetical protein Pint_27040 [Pistacia integerrima]
MGEVDICLRLLLLMMTNLKACFSKHSQWPSKSFRLRQARELVLHLSFLGCLKLLITELTHYHMLLAKLMTYLKACFSKHSQWPPKSFRLRQALRACAAYILPWMSENF